MQNAAAANPFQANRPFSTCLLVESFGAVKMRDDVGTSWTCILTASAQQQEIFANEDDV
jgi:hypothetical protein